MKGQIIIIALVFLTVIMILASSLFGRTADFLHFGANTQIKEQAIDLAEAGVDNALLQLNKTAGAYTGEVNTALGSTGTFTITVATKSQNLKTITSTGYIPNNSSPRATRTIKLDASINADSISFRYAAQTGSGGADMKNSSTINGTIYSNGNITGAGTSKITGDAWAVGTISSPDPTVLGSKHPGASPVPLPAFNYQQWKDLASQGGQIDCAAEPTECSITSSRDIGPKKYIGNLSISNNATVTVKGPVWVSKDALGAGGNFSMSQGGTVLKLDESFCSNSTVLIIDGTADLTQGGTFQTTNCDPKGYVTLVTTSTNSTAIQISQSGATAIFYAFDGGAVLSQSAHVSTLIANSLTMENSATLDYDSGLAGAQFSTCSTCPGASWTVKKGTYRFTGSP